MPRQTPSLSAGSTEKYHEKPGRLRFVSHSSLQILGFVSVVLPFALLASCFPVGGAGAPMLEFVIICVELYRKLQIFACGTPSRC